MAIEFACSHCSKTVQTPDSFAGKKGKCPHCAKIVQIPGGPATGGTSAAKSSPAQAKSPPKAAPLANENIEFLCPKCSKQVTTPGSFAGKKGKCPQCAAVIQIPNQSTAKPKPTTTPQTQANASKQATAQKLKFPCAKCKKEITCPATMAGKKGQCPHCKTTQQIPNPAQRKTAATPQPAAGGLTPLDGGGLQPLGDLGGGLQPLDSGGLQPLGGGSDPLAAGGLQPLGGGGQQPLGGGGGLQPLGGGGLQPLGGGTLPQGGGVPAYAQSGGGSNPYRGPQKTKRKRSGSEGAGILTAVAIFDFMAGIFWIGVGILGVLSMVLGTALIGMAAENSDDPDASAQFGVFAGGMLMIAIIVGIVAFGLGIFMIIKGMGVWGKKSWARYACIVVGILQAIGVLFGIGTVLMGNIFAIIPVLFRTLFCVFNLLAGFMYGDEFSE